jgi:spore coat polysaccharide biosynthesis protein SpsF
MVVGQFDSLTGFIIQARMQSTRLPGKVLMPLPFLSGKPILGHIVDALKPLGAKIIVATSELPENEQIVSFCKVHDVVCFLGDENDVLSRFLDIQKENQFQYIFRFTADNPLIDIKQLLVFFEEFIRKDLDYAYSKGMPLGMNFELFKGETLLLSEAMVESESDREHVTPAIKRNENFKTAEISLESLEHLRMTIDTPTDYALISMIFKYQNDSALVGVSLVKEFFKNYPWLNGLNSHIEQKSAE